MEECSLGLIFFIWASQTIWFSVGGGAVFPTDESIMKLDLLRQS